MLILNVSPKMSFLDSTVLTLFTLVKKPLCSRFTHFLFHKRFGSEYCNPCTVLNNISFLGESMVFLRVSLHIPFVHKRFLTHNIRSSTEDLLCGKLLGADVTNVIDGILTQRSIALFSMAAQAELTVGAVATQTTRMFWRNGVNCFSRALFSCEPSNCFLL